MTVSVIIPTFNRNEFLQRAVASVLRQTFGDLECVVVNDGGPPITSLPGDSRVRLVELGERRGPGGARNAGLDVATGEFVCFLDDDDLFEPGRVARGVDLARCAPIGLVNWVSRDWSQRGTSRFEGDFRAKVARGRWPALGQAMLPRALCARFGDTRVSEDFEWWLAMRHHARFAYTHEPLYIVERHREARVGVGRLTHFESRKSVLERHADFFQADRRAHAYVTARIASAALAAGEHGEAGAWAKRSISLYPSALGLRVAARAMSGARSHAPSG